MRRRLTAVLTAALTLTLGALLGVAVCNQTSYNWHAAELEDAVRVCTEQGLTDCHSEAIMQGLVVVDYDIIGWDTNNTATDGETLDAVLELIKKIEERKLRETI